jgi:hypothetical protein
MYSLQNRFIVLISIALLCFAAPQLGCAFILPSVYVEHLTVPGGSYQANTTLRGTFSIVNVEEVLISDLQYSILLLSEREGKLKVHADEIQSEKFSLKPKETQEKSFSYVLPPYLNSGSYTLRIQLFTAQGSPLGWEDAIIDFEGGPGSLILDDALVLRDKEQFGPGVGGTF